MACLRFSLSGRPRRGAVAALNPPAIAVLVLLCLSGPSTGDEALPPPAEVSRILFGSCLKESEPAPIFDPILAEEPELVLFLGDNIYADTEDMEVMRAKYARLAAIEGFAQLRLRAPVMATWDDHDYGENDAGAEYPMKREAQEIFVNFWGDPPDSPRRRRDGVYEARTLGPEGRRVQILMLDTRFFRGALKTGERRLGGVYYPDPDPGIPMLGEAQWQWLERRLREPAELRLLVSSIQFVASDAGQEAWSNLPSERQRLIDLIAATEAEGIVVLSGDRHWSELSRLDEGVPYPIYDLTSSSLNQVHPRGTPTENRWRISETTYHLENYGLVEINWEPEDPEVTLSIRDLEGATRLEHRLRLSELRF
jgi:alkaline phosphatase D